MGKQPSLLWELVRTMGGTLVFWTCVFILLVLLDSAF